MSPAFLTAISLVAGAALAAQAAANARLGVLLGSSGGATAFAFLAAFLVTATGLLVVRPPVPGMATVARVPPYLWLIGGLLSAAGVGTFYWLIPQLGVARVVALGLVGQLLFSTLASHFGWFELPVVRIGPATCAGAVCLVAGVVLIQGST